ncbi:hypothetical protein [Mycobacterium talmoniae]|uniref:Uncharacterized protein n=1 Tax=Mycobacterium talmoniae TaxID=1858794 RepID=A0A1S1NKY3_9MYCO|nr:MULTISPECIES: hypothetical protein [Mycobacterium]OHV04668.1 hypothetical protein BKN37_08850 [Mycobacterium talmoniae]PQM45293.1 hypothetical protein C1Y40_04550 [Mycobacterium talmoniae]TDH49301.1 hypothetical protein E2F47_21050 [Mycobacterium eburneum]
MRRPWGDINQIEWLWAQLRAGFRDGLRQPVPVVDLAGCENGWVSRRRWFTWRQANAVSAFGVLFIRDIVAALAAEDIAAAEPWLTQSTGTMQCGGQHRFLSSTGAMNGAYLTSRVAVPRGAVDSSDFYRRILPKVCQPYPVYELHPVWRGRYQAGPYGSRISVQLPGRQHAPNRDSATVDIVMTSPTYYHRFYDTDWPGTVGGRRWPLDPAAERVPIVYDAQPRKRPYRRDEVPDAAERTLAGVKEWGDYLGFRVGPATAEWRIGWDRHGHPTPPDYETYVVAAPVTLTATPEQLWERAQLYSNIRVVTGERPAVPEGHVRDALMSVGIHDGLRARITDPNADRRFELTINSDSFPVGRRTRMSRVRGG